MKTVNSFIVLTILFQLSCGSDQQKEQKSIKKDNDLVRIKGSESELPLTLKLVDFFKKHSDTAIKFNISGGGSNMGISLLVNDQIDMAMSSRKLKEKEKRHLAEKNIEIGEITVAYDALFIIVNKDNPLNKITSEQVKAIYTGEIRDWKELGGNAAPIVICSRRVSSGTKSFFESEVLSGEKVDSTVREFDNYSSLLELVKKDKGAIGFNSLGYASEEVKYLNISMDKGKTYFNVQEKGRMTKENYPLVRPLYLIYQKQSEKKFRPFLEFLKSDSAKALIRKAGFLQ